VFILLQFDVFIFLEARFQPNIGFTLRRVLVVFTRSAITQPKMNRFGWNLEHFKYISRDLSAASSGQILSSIRAVATAGKPDEILFFCQVNNARFHRFSIGQISRNLTTTRAEYSIVGIPHNTAV